MVLAITGSLLAVGLPTLIGARRAADDRVAQQTLATATSAARGVFADSGSFVGATAGRLPVHASVRVLDGTTASGRPSEVSVTVEPTRWTGAVLAAPGRCWAVTVGADGAVSGPVRSAAASCSATAHLTAGP